MGERNPDLTQWLYSNEGAAVAAGAYAGQQGDHNIQIQREHFDNARLWKVPLRISAIALDIREHDEGVHTTAEDIIAAAEANTTSMRNAEEEQVEAKRGSTLRHQRAQVHGHRPRKAREY